MLFSCQKSRRLEGVPLWSGKAAFGRQFPIVIADKWQLDVERYIFLVELTGIEPVTPWLQTRCSPS